MIRVHPRPSAARVHPRPSAARVFPCSSVVCISVASVAALAMTLVAPSAAQQVFKSGVDAVIIPVSVRSGNKPVAD